MIWASACDFQQCGILTCVDWDKPLQPHFKLRNPKWFSFSSLTIIEYSSDQQWLWSDCTYAQADLRPCWSHTPHCWKSHALALLCQSWGSVDTISGFLFSAAKNDEMLKWKSTVSSKVRWSVKVTIVHCRPTQGAVRKRHITLTTTRKPEDNKSCSLFLIEMIAELKQTPCVVWLALYRICINT